MKKKIKDASLGRPSASLAPLSTNIKYAVYARLKPFLVWFPFNLTSFLGQKFKKKLNSLEFKIFTQSFHPKLKNYD